MSDAPGPGRGEAARLLYTVAPRRPLDFFTELNARYGDAARISLPRGGSLYVLARPEHAEHVLATPRTTMSRRSPLGRSARSSGTACFPARVRNGGATGG